MKRTFKSISILLTLVSLLSCSQTHKEQNENFSVSEVSMPEPENISETKVSSSSVSYVSEEGASGLEESSSIIKDNKNPPNKPNNFIPTLAGTSTNDDDSHKFIRSAQIKFKVKNLPDATSKIEDIVIKNKGFILKSEINNQDSYSTNVNISHDSVLVTHYYRLTGNLQLKVPHTTLDSTLREIAPYAVEIDYRIVDARDVTLDIMSDKLKQARLNKKKNRVTHLIDNSSARLNDKIEAEDVLDRALEAADQTILSTYKLNEQIEYSIITIHLYESQTQYSERILKEETIKEFEPSLLTQTLDALNSGWHALSTVLIIILHIWPILIIGGVILFVYFRKKRKNQ